MNIEKDTINEEVVRDIVKAVESIRFGYVQVIIQDSKVVQIDKTEKIRLGNPKIKKGGGAVT